MLHFHHEKQTNKKTREPFLCYCESDAVVVRLVRFATPALGICTSEEGESRKINVLSGWINEPISKKSGAECTKEIYIGLNVKACKDGWPQNASVHYRRKCWNLYVIIQQFIHIIESHFNTLYHCSLLDKNFISNFAMKKNKELTTAGDKYVSNMKRPQNLEQK